MPIGLGVVQPVGAFSPQGQSQIVVTETVCPANLKHLPSGPYRKLLRSAGTCSVTVISCMTLSFLLELCFIICWKGQNVQLEQIQLNFSSLSTIIYQAKENCSQIGLSNQKTYGLCSFKKKKQNNNNNNKQGEYAWEVWASDSMVLPRTHLFSLPLLSLLMYQLRHKANIPSHRWLGCEKLHKFIISLFLHRDRKRERDWDAEHTFLSALSSSTGPLSNWTKEGQRSTLTQPHWPVEASPLCA